MGTVSNSAVKKLQQAKSVIIQLKSLQCGLIQYNNLNIHQVCTHTVYTVWANTCAWNKLLYTPLHTEQSNYTRS